MDKSGFCKFKIVLFAKDEDRNILFVDDRILRYYAPDKIIAVLDGNIESAARILAEKNIMFIRGPGKGKGGALKAAIQSIDSDIFVFMDADGSHNPEEIEGLLLPILNNSAEMVIASRFMGHSDEFYGNIENYIRLLGNKLGNFFINLFWNRGNKVISDCHNGLRVIKKESALALGLVENGFCIEAEMAIKCLKKGYRIIEVPSVESQQQYGRSHIRKLSFFCSYIVFLVKNLLRTAYPVKA